MIIIGRGEFCDFNCDWYDSIHYSYIRAYLPNALIFILQKLWFILLKVSGRWASYSDSEWPGLGACGSDRACDRKGWHHESHRVSGQEFHLGEDHRYGDQRLRGDSHAAAGIKSQEYCVLPQINSNIYENCNIAIAMSSSRADPVLGLDILYHCPCWGHLNI